MPVRQWHAIQRHSENNEKVAPHQNKNISSDCFHHNIATIETSNIDIDQELNKSKIFINITCFHIGIRNISLYLH